MSKKVDLAEKLQEEFEKLISEKENKSYEKYIKNATKEIIEKNPKTKKEAKKIIEKYKIDSEVSVKMFSLLNGITNKLVNDDTQVSRNKLKPLDPIMRAYDVNNPKTFANEMYQMTTNKKASKRNKKFRPLLLSYYSGFTENIESEKKQAQRALIRTQTEKSSEVFRDLEKLREERVPIRQAKKRLIKKYNNPKRVKRALDTELHEQAERVKLEQSKFMGFSYKKWNTQKDERVRRTKFHNQVKGKVVAIGEDFEAAGLKADFPGSLSLPVGERINCRCFVTYHNKKNAKISPKPIVEPKRKTIEEPIGSRAIQGSNVLENYPNQPKELKEQLLNPKVTNINKIIKEQQYNQNPQLVNKTRFNKQVDKNGIVISRGYWGKDKETAKRFRKEMESGEFFIENKGGAAHGRGMYFAGGNVNAFKFKFSQRTVDFYSKGAFRQENVKDDSQRIIDVATVTDDFKFIDGEQIDNKFEQFLEKKIFPTQSSKEKIKEYNSQKQKVKKLKKELANTDSEVDYYQRRDDFTFESENLKIIKNNLEPDIREKIDIIESILDDPELDHGTQAAMMGFDGIKNGSSHIVLNRSKIILLNNNGDVNDTYTKNIIQGKRV